MAVGVDMHVASTVRKVWSRPCLLKRRTNRTKSIQLDFHHASATMRDDFVASDGVCRALENIVSNYCIVKEWCQTARDLTS